MIDHEIEKISTLTPPELVGLVARFRTIGRPKIDLSRYSKEQIEALRAEQVGETHLEILFERDLGEFDFPGFEYVLSLYFPWKRHGTLPYPGAVACQPNKIMQCFQVLQVLEMEEAEREMKKKKLYGQLKR